ncbi:hypothetical protein L21TH_1495 [Caldisalinibacter kiritimatiensis]|uniref:Uncharacterized protein n=2 Tax=Caldisalinibacter kiritimatiensis TaxID=1304284 RepID=R1CUV6_9FIRM|nr:hypothetical protein L21TH_1495 [Caldisalinibacter kiritimatiensis]
MSIYPFDIINNKKKDLVISLNISKDTGVIVIYKKTNSNYSYVTKIEDLTYIDNISIFNTEALNKSFLIVEQILDERLGAFFLDNYVQIFTNINNTSFKEVLRLSKNYETYYYEKWTTPTIENPKWFKITEKNLIDYMVNEDELPIVNINKTLKKYEGFSSDDSIPENFELIQTKNISTSYYWSNKYKYFIQNEGKLKSTGELVGIIEKSNQLADSLLQLSKPYYKIVDKNGKIKYIKENKLSVIHISQ